MRLPLNLPTTNLLNLDRAGLEDFFAGLGEKPFRGRQVLKWMHQQRIDNFESMTNLSKDLRELLASQACITVPRIVSEKRSTDGTQKWVLELNNNNCIETVFIPEAARGTLCISSQVGCPLDCSFCSTGKQGFNRNLETGEIVGQLWLAAQQLDHNAHHNRVISNVVLMGMGEPLLNFDNVVRAIDLMLDDDAYGLARKRVTLSTAGVVPGIDRLREERPVSLAVSLHAPVDELRDELVPINRKYPLRELLDACRRYTEGPSDEAITFEYVMLQGINDSPALARELTKCLRGIRAKVNLIPFNPFPECEYQRSSQKNIEEFRDILTRSGLITLTRKTRGDDIDAACGQLVGKVIAKSARRRQNANSVGKLT